MHKFFNACIDCTEISPDCTACEFSDDPVYLGVCTACAATFTLTVDGLYCDPSPIDDCTTLNPSDSTICNLCTATSHWWEPTGKECLPCNDAALDTDCLTCEHIKECITCDNSKIPQADGLSCVTPAANCDVPDPDDSTKCSDCIIGWMAKPDGICYECSAQTSPLADCTDCTYDAAMTPHTYDCTACTSPKVPTTDGQ